MIHRCFRGSARREARGGLLLLAMLAAGCHERTGNVSGTVKFDGKPLTAGTVTFYDQKNGAFSSPINADGSYSVTGVRTGRAKITVALPMQFNFESSFMPGVKMTPPKVDVPPVPEKYFSAATSGLTYDVRGADQVYDIELTP
ncbi:MAG TPA: carboxypeptidase-like regulatory domain-containing protein [Gemmataceae bacterium]|jgi:hypothetical protein|nr:carboxypeptidase-like regulatory domain-containing protein [Gemmataceae bacterium]